MDVLSCQNLAKTFGGVRAIDDVTLDLATVGITAIIGPNGAGKTTLLNIVTGCIRPDAGRCFLGTHEITHLSPNQIARLGAVRTFQELRLIRRMSLIDNVLLSFPDQRGEGLLAALVRSGQAADEGANVEEAFRLLQFVGLEGQRAALAGELSYGQQKLLTLACCVATNARLLLLDEPLAGVGPMVARDILDLLRRLRDLGKRIVFIEHDIAAVREVSDQVIVMNEGKIIAEGTPGDVLQRSEIVEAYLG